MWEEALGHLCTGSPGPWLSAWVARPACVPTLGQSKGLHAGSRLYISVDQTRPVCIGIGRSHTLPPRVADHSERLVLGFRSPQSHRKTHHFLGDSSPAAVGPARGTNTHLRGCSSAMAAPVPTGQQACGGWGQLTELSTVPGRHSCACHPACGMGTAGD